MLPAHLKVSKCRHCHNEHCSCRTNTPLGLTGVLCDTKFVNVTRNNGTVQAKMQYTVFRPRYLRNTVPPLFCIAGGPLLPHTYLSPLVHLLSRAVVFYSPLGVGQSKIVSNKNNATVDLTNIDEMVQDFATLVDHLMVQSTDKFHLYGHSFGGIIAFEYIKQITTASKVQSLILSNAPSSVARAVQASKELLEEINSDDNAQSIFTQRHECRVTPIPLPLQQSLEMAGFQSSSKGLECVKDYEANSAATTIKIPPTLVIKGEYDFVQQDWTDVIPDAKIVTIPNTSHYGMLEDEKAYGRELNAFLQANDPKVGPIRLANGVVINR